jgi:hypothetical protein
VTAWEPGRRFAYRGGSPDSAELMAFEWLIEGRDDGTCVLRLVQSGVLGDKVRLTPEGLAPIEGVVDYVSPEVLGVRTEDGLYRFIRGDEGSVAVGHHLFGGDVDQEEAERAWQAWLSRLFEAHQDTRRPAR